MKKTDIDDMTLNAFVDHQTDPHTAEKIIRAMEEDTEIRERVYQFRRIRDLMKLSFKDARPPVKISSVQKISFWNQIRLSGFAAAILMIVVGISSGMYGYYAGKQTGQVSATMLAKRYQDRLILHVSKSNPEHFSRVLAYVKTFLHEHEKYAEGKTSRGQIEVVAHAGGLDLMRKGVSPYEQEIILLMKQYANVHFVACANGIRTLLDKGITPNIIDGIPTDETAFDRIVSRLQTGWTYLKVDSISEI